MCDSRRSAHLPAAAILPTPAAEAVPATPPPADPIRRLLQSVAPGALGDPRKRVLMESQP